MQGRARSTLPRCVLLRGSRLLRSPLAVQLSISPARSCHSDRLRRVGVARSLPNYISTGAPDGDDKAARIAGEALIAEMRGSMSDEQLAVVARPETNKLRSVKAVWEVAWDTAPARCKADGGVHEECRCSEEGVRCALASVRLALVPGSVGAVPTRACGQSDLGRRLVSVWRDGILSRRTELDNLLRANSGLTTAEERDVVNSNRSVVLKARLKGVAATDKQTVNLAAFWSLVGLSNILQFTRTTGAGGASFAFAKVGVGEPDAAWRGMKVKTAVAHPTSGRLGFKTTVKEIRNCLSDGHLVLLIGLEGDQPSIAYLFHDPEALEALHQIPASRCNTMFMPRLHPKLLVPKGLPNLLQPFRVDLRSDAGLASVPTALLAALDAGTLYPISAL